MPNFVSTSQLLRRTYEEKKDQIVKAAPMPVSEICSSCWYKDPCIIRTMMRTPPRTCCIYDLFGNKGTSEITLEELVKFTCEEKCVERREWIGDPCPHNEEYCTHHCPVSRHILDRGPSSDVPYEGY